jgi:hypothetical protein
MPTFKSYIINNLLNNLITSFNLLSYILQNIENTIIAFFSDFINF